jgi:hypothetical protein
VPKTSDEGVGIVTPVDPMLQTEVRTFNRRLAVNALGQPVLDGNGDQVWYNQINSLYYSHPLILPGSITSLAYHTVYLLSTDEYVRGETWPQEFDPVTLASFAAPYVSGGVAWNGLLRIDVPKAAFAGQPQKIIVVLNGEELPERPVSWEVLV